MNVNSRSLLVTFICPKKNAQNKKSNNGNSSEWVIAKEKSKNEWISLHNMYICQMSPGSGVQTGCCVWWRFIGWTSAHLPIGFILWWDNISGAPPEGLKALWFPHLGQASPPHQPSLTFLPTNLVPVKTSFSHNSTFSQILFGGNNPGLIPPTHMCTCARISHWRWQWQWHSKQPGIGTDIPSKCLARTFSPSDRILYFGNRMNLITVVSGRNGKTKKRCYLLAF